MYLAMGGAATGLDWFSFYLLTANLGAGYLPAVSVSFTLGAALNYVLNKFLTFRDRTEQIFAQVGIYTLLCAFSLILSAGWMYLLVEKLNLSPMAARMVTTGIMLLVNFTLHKFLTYNSQLYLRLGRLRGGSDILVTTCLKSHQPSVAKGGKFP